MAENHFRGPDIRELLPMFRATISVYSNEAKDEPVTKGDLVGIWQAIERLATDIMRIEDNAKNQS